jgi:hypothetical protein
MRGNPRRTVAIVIALVVVLAVIGVVAYRAGRSHSATTPPSSSPTTQPSTLNPRPSDPSTAASSSPSGTPQPGLQRGTATAGGGGRTTGPDGLPLGFPDTSGGAATAATDYLMWLNSFRITDKAKADAMAQAAAADTAARTALIHSCDEIRSGMHGLTADQLEPARGAYALASYSSTDATVYVWAPEVTTETDGTTTQLWAIDAVRVVWAGGDWKLDGDLILKVGGAASDPADPAGNPSSAEKRAILAKVPSDPGDITDSADQAWFEYANAAR